MNTRMSMGRGVWAVALAFGWIDAALAAGNASVTTNGTEVTVDASGGAETFYLREAYGSEITKVVKTGKDVVEYQPEAPTSYGALEILGGQFRIWRADSLGSGTVLIDGLDASSKTPAQLVTYGYGGAAYTLTNKIVFGSAGYFMPVGNSPVLTSVGSSQTGGSRFIRLGRSGGASSSATLALTDAASEAIDQIRVRGAFGLKLDGGTLKAGATAQSPFLYDLDGGAYAKTCTIASKGVAIDVAAGGDVAFGPVPAFRSAVLTNCVETWQPSNYSFENGSTDWTIASNTNVSDEVSGVKPNGSAFDTENGTAWPTTNGTNYAMVRRNGSLSRTVSLPTAGLWRLTFEMGCRPTDSYSWWITTTVKVDGIVVLTIPAIASSAGKHGFLRYETEYALLAAGEHRISVELSDSSARYASLNFDCFQFERGETSLQVPCLAKDGAGRLAMEDLTVDGPVQVRSGTLALACPELKTNATLSVAAGATLELSDAKATIVANGSFEEPALAATGYKADNPTGWTRSLTDATGTYRNANGNGYQANGSPFAGMEDTPCGNQTVYLRNYAKYEQTLTGVTAGVYRLSFVQSPRKGYSSHLIRTSVKIDGGEVLAAGPLAAGSNPFVRYAAEVTLSAGDHTLSFDTTGDVTQEGATVLVDDVRLERLVDCALEGEVRMASGSTLVLNNAHKVVIGRFFVDGQPVSGNAAAIRRAGVTVEGEGRIRVGEQRRFLVIVR